MPNYFGNSLSDLQRGIGADRELDARKRIAADEIAARQVAARLQAQLEQQRMQQQGSYQQGQLDVARRQADAESAMAAANMIFSQTKHADDTRLAEERNRLMGKEIDARYPGEGQRIGEQRLKNEQAERDAMRLIEEHNNAATAAAARFNAQRSSRINASKLLLDDQQKSRGDEWLTLNSTAKTEFDEKRKAMEAAGWPTETQTVLDLISKDPDAGKVVFDGGQFIPKLMKFSPTASTPGAAVTPAAAAAAAAGQQIFGTQTSSSNSPASSPLPTTTNGVWAPSAPTAPAAPDNRVFQVQASDGSVWQATPEQFRTIKQRDPGARIMATPARPAAASRGIPTEGAGGSSANMQSILSLIQGMMGGGNGSVPAQNYFGQ